MMGVSQSATPDGMGGPAPPIARTAGCQRRPRGRPGSGCAAAPAAPASTATPPRRRQRQHRVSRRDERDGSVLEVGRGVGIGTHLGQLLELERPLARVRVFESTGSADTPASRAARLASTPSSNSRASQCEGTRREPAETGQNGPTHIPRSGQLQPIQMAGHGLDRGIAQVGQQLAEQERVPTRYSVTGVDEPILRMPGRRGDHACTEARPTWLRADLHSLGLGGQQPEQLMLIDRLGPCRYQKGKLQPVQMPREIGQMHNDGRSLQCASSAVSRIGAAIHRPTTSQ
jgi:hypothetical protein